MSALLLSALLMFKVFCTGSCQPPGQTGHHALNISLLLALLGNRSKRCGRISTAWPAQGSSMQSIVTAITSGVKLSLRPLHTQRNHCVSTSLHQLCNGPGGWSAHGHQSAGGTLCWAGRWAT
jgi:hypothetical protein